MIRAGGDRGEGIPEALLAPLAEWLEATVGLRFSPSNRRQFEQRMAAAREDFGFGDLESFAEWLVTLSPTREQIELLAAHLTIGETYFYREEVALRALTERFLPSLMEARCTSEKRLRFWSAGCSTGEEPYSLAILLDQLVPDLADWNVSILATDINPVALRKADQARYSDWSFRETPAWFRDYFERIDQRHYRLRPEIRALVTFRYLNLSSDTYPSIQSNTNALDFILCRNVLMYFAPERARAVLERFHRCLLDGGYLIVSPVETPLLSGSPFVPVHEEGWTFHRKGGRPAFAPREVERKARAAKGAQAAAAKPATRPALSPRPEPVAPPAPAPSTPLQAAETLVAAGRYEEAEAQLRSLVAHGDRSHATVQLLGRVLANRGQLAEALAWCDEALSAARTDPGPHYLRATILQEEQRFDEARAGLQRALYLDPNFVLAHFALANLALRAGKTDEARRHLSNVRTMLTRYAPDAVLPEADGLTASGLAGMIAAVALQEGV